MSQNVEVVDVESIEIGRRIKEILDEKKREKGNAFSIRAFATRIGMGKDTLRDIMKGLRTVRPSELEKIAEGLGMTVARLKGADTIHLEQELSKLVKGRTNLKRALELATTLQHAAIGCTQRFEVLNNLGAVYYLQKQYETARDIWLEALPQAKIFKDLHGDTLPIYKVTTNLIHTYTELNDYMDLSKMLDDLQPQFSEFHPLCAGTIIHSQAMTAFNLGNLKRCQVGMYQLLDIYEHLEPVYRGFAYQNVGYIEYLLGDYEQAKIYFEKAIVEKSSDSLKDNVGSRLISVKDYVKCLLKLQETNKAAQIIEASLAELTGQDLPELNAKFLLLHAVSNNEPASAEKVINSDPVGQQLKILACDFLMKHYAKLGDSDSLMKYYKIADDFKSAQINWEGI